MERCNAKKLNKGNAKEHCQVTIRKKFAALANLRGQWERQKGMERY
jgi:hypothetical protein